VLAGRGGSTAPSDLSNCDNFKTRTARRSGFFYGAADSEDGRFLSELDPLKGEIRKNGHHFSEKSSLKQTEADQDRFRQT
jgi:hypothetical protein